MPSNNISATIAEFSNCDLSHTSRCITREYTTNRLRDPVKEPPRRGGSRTGLVVTLAPCPA